MDRFSGAVISKSKLIGQDLQPVSRPLRRIDGSTGNGVVSPNGKEKPE
jgi:hypothetical protein